MSRLNTRNVNKRINKDLNQQIQALEKENLMLNETINTF